MSEVNINNNNNNIVGIYNNTILDGQKSCGNYLNKYLHIVLAEIFSRYDSPTHVLISSARAYKYCTCLQVLHVLHIVTNHFKGIYI